MFEVKRMNNNVELEKIAGRTNFINFLFTHLEQYSDPKEHISGCIDYAFSNSDGKGGFLLVGFEDDRLVGAVIMN
ncbi:MAG: GNAT family N-acetyltransferase, partial [Candidatus Marinimicrobia bacterium]|nr:GNAT family N-acetyltransferase [Candidatus Neomarinimicrobiota bacterium]